MNKVEKREAVTFESEGDKIFGILHRPLVDGKYPGLIFCHGFAGNKAGRNRLYVTLAKRLAQLGFVVLRFDFRGSGDSEGEFRDITIEGEVNDAINALHYLENHPQVDNKRIGIVGRSLGGVIALLAAQRHGNIKSINIWAPLFDTSEWSKKWKEHPVLEQVPRELRINGEFPNNVFLDQFFHLDLFPTLNALRDTPLLHIHGEQDTIVKINHADLFASERKAANATSKFIRLPDSDHDFSNLPEQTIAVTETCQWFQDTL